MAETAAEANTRDPQGIEPGVVVGEWYRIVRLIGEGGMGRVFLAEDTRDERQVALKVLTDDRPIPKAAERFAREAQSIARIEHENVVSVFDVGESPRGGLYYVMEYLEGEELADTLEREGSLPWERARDIALQVCSALQAAHEKGVVHRDLKLENCFRVPREGEPDFIKILDFGVAKLLGPEPDGNDRLTNTGATLGTPIYMAPELCRGKHIDHRVDVYALGVMLYEMIAGTPPFQGEAFLDVALMHMNDPPPPLAKQVEKGTLPVGLEAAVMRALAKAREDRFPTMAAFARALRKVGKDTTVPAIAAYQTSGPIVVKGGTEPRLDAAPIVDAPRVGGTVPALPSHQPAPLVAAEFDDDEPAEPRTIWRGVLGGLLGAGAVFGAVLWWQVPQGDSTTEAKSATSESASATVSESASSAEPSTMESADSPVDSSEQEAAASTGDGGVTPPPAQTSSSNDGPPTKADRPTPKKKKLSRSQIKRGIKSVKPLISACAGRFTGGKVGEKVSVSMTIDQAGHVQKARAKAEGGISAVENCVVEAVKRGQFDSIGSSPQNYRHTLRL